MFFCRKVFSYCLPPFAIMSFSFYKKKISLSTFCPTFSIYFPYFSIVFFSSSHSVNMSWSSRSPFRLEFYWDHNHSCHHYMQSLYSQSEWIEMSTVSQINLWHYHVCNGICTFSAVQSFSFCMHPNGLFALLHCGT